MWPPGWDPALLPSLAPGHDVLTSMTIEKRVKENSRQEHKFLEHTGQQNMQTLP